MRLKTDIFPINYFKSIWTPIQAFKSRYELNWFMIVIVFIFLNALMTIPVTINYAKMDSFPLEDFYPHVTQIINEQTINELKKAEYINGEMIINEPFIVKSEQGVITGGLTTEEINTELDAENKLMFQQNQFLISEEGASDASVLYTKDFSLANKDTIQEVNDELSRQWFNQNRVLIVLFFSLMISAFLFVMTLLLVFGSAIFLYLTKNSPITSIITYKESVNLLLNILALPTFVSMILGLIYFDIILMVSIQTIGVIIMLFVIFYKTQFNDQNLVLTTEQGNISK